jgi:hypothetical protein
LGFEAGIGIVIHTIIPSIFLLLCSSSDEPYCGRDGFVTARIRPKRPLLMSTPAFSRFDVAGKLACRLRSLERLHWVFRKLQK